MKPPIISIVGKSDVGKTTMLEKLLPELVRRGLKIGTVKHDVHGFSIDHEGKDSYRHKQAGSSISLISSPWKIGMVRDVDHDHTLAELRDLLLSDMDLIVTEGYKRESWPKVEIHRKALARPLIATPDEGLIAVVADEQMDAPVPHFDLDDPGSLADFLIEHFGLKKS